MMVLGPRYRLFNSAYLMFGPHGAGMANSLWMQSPALGLHLADGLWSELLVRDMGGCQNYGPLFGSLSKYGT